MLYLGQGCPKRGPMAHLKSLLCLPPPPNFTVSYLKSKLYQKYSFSYETARFGNRKGGHTDPSKFAECGQRAKRWIPLI